jgi:rfaE bifunctional protein kinase chain/domain
LSPARLPFRHFGSWFPLSLPALDLSSTGNGRQVNSAIIIATMLHAFLSHARLNHILSNVPRRIVGVVGDLFLDRYLDIDASLTEPSLETGLDAYQVTRVRSIPGAAGTVINNLTALGVLDVRAISVIGDDGEGSELLQALTERGVSRQWLHIDKSRRTPTYMKPMFHEAGKPARELNRLDIKNRTAMSRAAVNATLAALDGLWPELDALVVLDQVSEPECGVVTSEVRARLADMGSAFPDKVLLVDSRERIGLFQSVWMKPNQRECSRAILHRQGNPGDTPHCTRELARRTGRPVFCTCGAEGILIVDPRSRPIQEERVSTVRITGPIDPVGAGDSTSAALVCALAAGASLTEAAAFANLVASITIRQLGTTGTARPDQILAAYEECLTEG